MLWVIYIYMLFRQGQYGGALWATIFIIAACFFAIVPIWAGVMLAFCWRKLSVKDRWKWFKAFLFY